MARRLIWILLVSFSLGLTFMGCDCGTTVRQCGKDSDCQGSRVCPSKTGRCACQDGRCKAVACLKDFQCPDGQKCVDYACKGSDRCTQDSECGPGETCNTITGICNKAGCQADGDCTKAGQKCCNLDDGRGQQCNYQRCLKHEDCRTGSSNTCVEPLKCEGGIIASCIKGSCKCQEPCGGGDCGTGKCCDVAKDACVENPTPCPDLKCPEGTDPPKADDFTVDPKSCELKGPKCECIKRAPLPLGVVGEHSEIGLYNGQPVVSAYNQTYGDLVVGFKQADGTIKWEFVDGIPAAGKVTGATDGPRGGIEDAGDDVGKYTSVAVSAGVIHVSYYDATNSTLKYARRENDKWSTHTVDKDGQMVGRFTSITISNGVPVIAYFVGNNNKGESQLRIATAKSATPGAEADWTVAFAATKPLPKCKGACDDSKNEVCTESNKVFSCKVPTADPDKCKPTACDKDTQVCVAGKCLTKVDDSTPPLPNGTGLFPSIATLQGGGVVVVYYVKDSGDLAIATENAGNFQVKTLKTAGDVGQFPSVAVDASGLIHISYINNDTADVHYLQLDAQYNIKVDEVVDNGNINGEDRQLADTSIAVAAGGDVRIVYQDASVQAIKMAVRRGPKQWEAKNLASGDDSPYKGAFGFFADQIIDNNTSHISNFKVNLRDDKNPSGIDIRTWP